MLKYFILTILLLCGIISFSNAQEKEVDHGFGTYSDNIENVIKSEPDRYFLSEVINSITKRAVKRSNTRDSYGGSPYNTLLYYIYAISPFCGLDSLKIPPPKDAEEIEIEDEYWQPITATWEYKNKEYYFKIRKMQKEMRSDIFFEGCLLKTIETDKETIITRQVSSTTEQFMSRFRKYSDTCSAEFVFRKMAPYKNELCGKRRTEYIYYKTNVEIRNRADSVLLASVEIRESIYECFSETSVRDARFEGDSIRMKVYLNANQIRYETYYSPGNEEQWAFNDNPGNGFNKTFLNQKRESIKVWRIENPDGTYKFEVY